MPRILARSHSTRLRTARKLARGATRDAEGTKS